MSGSVAASRLDPPDVSVVGAPGAMLVIISGPSGVGKDTILQELKKRYPDRKRHFVVTYKTRARRPLEVDGVDYHFVGEDEFRRMTEEGAFLEATKVHDHWAATPCDQVVEALTSGKDAVLKIDVKGAKKVQARVPDALLIFVAPPSLEELVGRLVSRGTETPEAVAQRRRDAEDELAHQVDYDHVVVNHTGQVEETARRIDEIIEAEHRLHPDRRVRL